MSRRIVPVSLVLSLVLLSGCNALDNLFGDDGDSEPAIPEGALVYEGADHNGVVAVRGWLTYGPAGDATRVGKFHFEPTGLGDPSGQPIGDGAVMHLLADDPEAVELRLENDFTHLGPVAPEYWRLHGLQRLDGIKGPWERIVDGAPQQTGTFAVRRAG